ncbi:MAG: hypothetical protein IJ780_04565, partial [Neisseriaceae bacterium]|nr:hypothetical protein [Neisseriaceae bacterium]
MADFHDNNGISQQNGWTEIIPNAFGDWINQRDPNFDRYISIGDKKDKTAVAVFENYSGGVKTNRDTWCWNFLHKSVAKNIGSMIDFYNSELKRYQASGANIPCKDFVNLDTTKWSYGRDLEQKINKNKQLFFDTQSIHTGLYRPFSKSYIY